MFLHLFLFYKGRTWGQRGSKETMSSEVIKNEKTETKKYRTWLMKSILVTVFCNCYLGIIGIVYAVKARRSYKIGKMDEFVRFSLKARTWTLLGFMLTISSIVFIGSCGFVSILIDALIALYGYNALEDTWILLLAIAASYLTYIIFLIVNIFKIGGLLEKGQEIEAAERRQRTRRVSLFWFIGTIVIYVFFSWGYYS